MPNTTRDSRRKHQQWLRLELAAAGLDHDYLIALLIQLERAIARVQRRPPPFYGLNKSNGTASRAWLFAAEAALWLNYKGYDPHDWFSAICEWPPIKRRLLYGERLPISMFVPLTRLSTKRLKRLEAFYIKWMRTHAAIRP